MAAAGISPFLHFLENGAGDGRSPNASVASQIGSGFDEAAYLAANPDIADAIANGTFSNAYEHWLLLGFNESRSGAQNTNGDTIQQPTNDGTPNQNPDGAPGETPGGIPGGGGGGGGGGAPIPVASQSGSELDLINLAGTSGVITLNGSTLTMTANNNGSRSQAFDLNGIDTIDLNGFNAEMTSTTLDALVTALAGKQISIAGLSGGGGSSLNISGVDFGDIRSGPITAPNVAVFEFDGLSTEDLIPTAFTVNGSYADAIKSFCVALDGNYYGALPVQNAEVNTNFLRLGNDYVEFLQGGNAALLDVVQTKAGTPDYTVRQQTLHDNILGNLGDGAVNWRVGQGATDVRTTIAQQFDDRPSPSGRDGSLDDFQNAKDWDLDAGNDKGFAINRTDTNIIVKIGQLDDIARDGSDNMWNGTNNSSENFRIVQLVNQEIELGLKAKVRKVRDYNDNERTDLLETTYYTHADPQGGEDGIVWNSPGYVNGGAAGSGVEPVAAWSFDFSVATNIDEGNLNAPELSDYQFRLLLDVDRSENTSFVTLVLDPNDAGNWLFQSAEDADVASVMESLLTAADPNNRAFLTDNVGENDSNTPTFVSQNSQNYGFANGSYEMLVNAFDNVFYEADGTKSAGVDYWEAESEAGHFRIGLEAYTADGVTLFGQNYIEVASIPVTP